MLQTYGRGSKTVLVGLGGRVYVDLIKMFIIAKNESPAAHSTLYHTYAVRVTWCARGVCCIPQKFMYRTNKF